MKDLLREVDAVPVTIVTAIAYGTLAVVTQPFGDPREFGQLLERFGWLTPHDVIAGEPWRLLTHAYLHGGAVHLLFNLATLFAFGPALERSLGSVRFLLLYVVSALGGALAVCCTYEPNQPVVGGSGALFGMMGAAMAMNMRSGRHVLAFLDFDGPRRLLGAIAANLVLGFFFPMISNTAHVGGLLAGFLLTFLWLRPGDATLALQRWRLASLALLAGATFSSFVPATRIDWLAMQFEATDDPQRREALLRAVYRTGKVVPVAEPQPRGR